MSPILRPNLPNTNSEAVRIVEGLLEDLKAGRVTTMGLITVTALGQVNVGASGMQGESVYIGCDLLKNQILAAVVGRRIVPGAA